MDLWLMIINGRVESRVFTKSKPIYISPTSCHDPAVFKSIFTGVGLRLRLNSSRDEDFDVAVEEYSKAFAVSGYNYRRAKFELSKSKQIDRVEFLQN